LFLSKKEYALFVNHWRSLCVLCGFARKNHPRGNRMVIPHHLQCNSLFISPAVCRMGINPIPTVAECSNVLIISVLHVLFLHEVITVAKCSNVLIISVLHVLFCMRRLCTATALCRLSADGHEGRPARVSHYQCCDREAKNYSLPSSG
jgi:hypothetical protein